VQVATPPTASEFRGGIIGVTLRPVSGPDFVTPITDKHWLHTAKDGRLFLSAATIWGDSLPQKWARDGTSCDQRTAAATLIDFVGNHLSPHTHTLHTTCQ